MAILTQIELPTGSVYDLVDQGARDLIDAINNWEYVVCTSAADTPQGVQWTSGGTTITGTLVAASTTMYKIYLVPSANGTNDIYDEYVTVNPSGTTYTWEMFGNTTLPDMTQYVKNKSGHSGGTAGDLAYKDSASGSGSVAIPSSFTTTITPAAKDVSVSGTTTGSVSVTKSAVTVSKAASGTATYTPAGTNAASTVSGSCTVTPSGTISKGTGTANYTPEGSVAAPTISVATAGSTTTIKNPTSKTVVTDMSVADPSATAATGELVYCTVSGTKLSLKKFVETTGDSITTSNVTVKNGDASYSASAPAFTGTGAELKFTGSSSSGTISGTAAAQTFTGTGARLVTDSEVATDASFTGASMTSTGSYTPAAGTATTTVAGSTSTTVNVTVS